MTGKAPRTALTVALMMGATVLSKLLGMLRGVFMASAYGTGMEAVAFSAASRIPLSFFDLLFSACILGCFIPVYNSFTAERESERNEFACVFLNLILLMTGVLSIAGILFAKPAVAMIAPGLDAETSALAVKLLRVIFPMIIFTGGAYTLVGVMQSRGRYLLPAAISSVSNICVILYFIFLNGKLGENGITGLAFCYLIAWALQLVTLAAPLLKSGVKYRLTFRFGNPALKSALKSALPVMIGSWLIPFGYLSGTFFATFTDTPGAVTVFEYANNLYIIIAGVLVYSVCNYAFPKLSRFISAGDTAGFAESARVSLLALAAITLPFLGGAFVLVREGVAAVYLGNKFTPADTENVSSALRLLLPAIPAFAATEFLSRTFFSCGEPKLPMAAALAGVGVNIAVSAVAVCGFRLGLEAVALANTAGQLTSGAILVFCAGRKPVALFNRQFLISLIKIILCAAAATAVMLLIHHFVPGIVFERGRFANLLVCAAVFLPSAAVYALLLRITRTRIK